MEDIHVYGPPERFMYEGDYHVHTTIVPQRDRLIDYLREEIERASLIFPKRGLAIGIGIISSWTISRLAKEALGREELSDDVGARAAEIELRAYATRFPNVRFVSINTGPCHISKMPIHLIGHYPDS